MLVELRVRDLGVIADLELVIGPGMTALTGETGAGKTLVVEALELLLGGRADAAMVRAGAVEAVVEGRFVVEEREVVLSRAVPVDGRSRAYLNGRMAPASSLSEIGDGLVDLHGQHVHQSLLHQAAQRDALDRFAGADLDQLTQARRELAAIEARLADLGGDPRVLARTVGLLRFQLDELAAAAITTLDEEEQLAAEESLLAQVGALRAAIGEARDTLVGSDASQAHSRLGAADLLGMAASRLAAHEALCELAVPLRAAQADVEDVARELRLRDERLEEDPDRLEAVRQRLQLLADLRRKYGPSLADVLEFERASQAQLADLEAAEETRGALEVRRRGAAARCKRRRSGSGPAAVRPRPSLLPRSRLTCTSLPLVALDSRFASVTTRQDRKSSSCSGRTRENRRFHSRRWPPAGSWPGRCSQLGWSCPQRPRRSSSTRSTQALAARPLWQWVARLCAIGRDHQVLVVTHLAQVAAFADQQVLVSKSESEGRTVARVRPVTDEDRVVELSRMLSGHPDSATARRHAKELLAMAAKSVTTSGSSDSLE